MEKFMSKEQRRQAVTLIKQECCNYYSGYCCLMDMGCPQVHSESLMCKWFRDAVLPLDKVLYAQIMGEEGLKDCEVCGRPFRAISNRAKYCNECKAKIQRKQARARKQKERGVNVTL